MAIGRRSRRGKVVSGDVLADGERFRIKENSKKTYSTFWGVTRAFGARDPVDGDVWGARFPHRICSAL